MVKSSLFQYPIFFPNSLLGVPLIWSSFFIEIHYFFGAFFVFFFLISKLLSLNSGVRLSYICTLLIKSSKVVASCDVTLTSLSICLVPPFGMFTLLGVNTKLAFDTLVETLAPDAAERYLILI